MAVRNLLNAFHIAGISVYMDRNDRGSFFRDQALQFVHIDRIILFIDIAEDRSQTIAHNGVGRGSKAERRGNDLPGQLHGLQRQFQRHMAVHKQFQIRCL